MNGFVFVPSTGNTQAGGLMSVFNRGARSSAPSLVSGDVITALLTSREDGKAALRTEDDFTFTVPGNSVQGDVGETLHFKVVSQDRSGLALRQVFPHLQAAKEASIERGNAGIEDVQYVAKSLEQMNEEAAYRAEEQKDQQVKASQVLSQVRRSQRFVEGNSTRAAIAAIAAAGLDLNKIGFFELSNVIQEIEAMPDASPEAATAFGGEAEAGYTAPVITETLPDPAVAYLLKSGKEITQETVYAARYSTAGDAPVDLEKWDTLDKQIAKRFKREDIENTPQNMEAAKFLVAYNLPITRQNIEHAVMLRNADLVPTAIETAQKLPNIKPQDVKAVLEAGQPLNLQHLIDVQSNVDYDTQPVSESQYVPREKLVTAQRQLAEIQWKMTVQAAIRLAHKGIEINTEPLQELVEHLRSLESEGHAKALRAMGSDVSHTAQMEQIFRAIEDIKPVAAHIHANVQAKVLNRQVDFNLAGVHKAAKAYKANATMADPRYGDDFDKVSDQFKPLLSRLGVAPTNENIRAAMILSRNEMDVALPAIEAVKTIDAKIAAVTDRLSPMMAAQMLKDGHKPLTMHMDELLSYIRKFEEQHGYSGGDKIAQYILEMDRSNTLTPEERSGMIDVYRMLHIIQKNGSAALGLALKQSSPLTLGSLMEAAKFYESHKKDLNAQPGPVSYTDLLADAVIDKGAPPILQQWLPDDKPLEDMLHQSPVPPSFKPDIEMATEAVRQFTEAPPSLIVMLQNAGVLPTPENIKAARKRVENTMLEALAEAIAEIRANNPGLDALLEPSDIGGALRELMDGEESHKKLTDQLLDALGDAPQTEAVKEAQALLTLQSAMSDDDDAIDVPLQLNGRYANLKLYTLNENAVADGSARAFLTLATEGLGNVQSYFDLDDGKVNLQFAVEGPVARLQLEANIETLRALLEEAGYEIGDLVFTYLPSSELESEEPSLVDGKEIAVDPEEEYTPLEVSDYEFTV